MSTADASDISIEATLNASEKKVLKAFEGKEGKGELHPGKRGDEEEIGPEGAPYTRVATPQAEVALSTFGRIFRMVVGKDLPDPDKVNQA